MGGSRVVDVSDYTGNDKPYYYRRYMDDTFLLFKESTFAQSFFNHVNSVHPNIKFTVEHEENGKLPFLDITVSRDGDTLLTSVFRKLTFTGKSTNYFSSIYCS